MEKHVVIARFDQKTDELFNQWKSEAEAIQNRLYDESSAWPAHMTIAAYEGMDESLLREWTYKYTRANHVLNIRFASLGVFAHGKAFDTDVIYVNPCTSLELVKFYYGFHERYDEFCGNYGRGYSSKEGMPVFHSTITVCNMDRFNPIFDKLRDEFFVVNGKIIALEVYQNPYKFIGRYELNE